MHCHKQSAPNYCSVLIIVICYYGIIHAGAKVLAKKIVVGLCLSHIHNTCMKLQAWSVRPVFGSGKQFVLLLVPKLLFSWTGHHSRWSREWKNTWQMQWQLQSDTVHRTVRRSSNISTVRIVDNGSVCSYFDRHCVWRSRHSLLLDMCYIVSDWKSPRPECVRCMSVNVNAHREWLDLSSRIDVYIDASHLYNYFSIDLLQCWVRTGTARETAASAIMTTSKCISCGVQHPPIPWCLSIAIRMWCDAFDLSPYLSLSLLCLFTLDRVPMVCTWLLDFTFLFVHWRLPLLPHHLSLYVHNTNFPRWLQSGPSLHMFHFASRLLFANPFSRDCLPPIKVTNQTFVPTYISVSCFDNMQSLHWNKFFSVSLDCHTVYSKLSPASALILPR